MTITDEDWCAIAGHPGYEVSTRGRVRSLVFRNGVSERSRQQPLIMAVHKNPRGYMTVMLSGRKRHRVHRLVLEAFVGTAPGMEVGHLNGDRADNRLSNLAWVTGLENKAHQLMHGTRLNGEKNPNCKLAASDVAKIVGLLGTGLAQKEIAKQFGVHESTVSDIKLGKRRRIDAQLACKEGP